MRLFIAEKPELARAIAQALDGKVEKFEGYSQVGDDVITWCFGHLLRLCDPEHYNPDYKRWDMTHLPLQLTPIQHEPIADKKKQINIIGKLIKQADTIVHAGDPDDEGQLLIDEVLTFFNNAKPVLRLLINDNNTQIVKKALNNLKDNQDFYGLYQSALARSIADQWYGYNLSRGYTLSARAKGHQGVLSVGRVQTPILGLVVRRDAVHESHEAQRYYTLSAQFEFDTLAVDTKLIAPADAPVDDKGRIIDEAYLQNIVSICDKQTGIAKELTHDIKYEPAPLPYNLLNLQAEASQKLGISPDKTLEITQTLREKHRLITYNRSDCQYLSDEQHNDAKDVLAAIAQNSPDLNTHAQSANPELKSRAFNSEHVSAHHAIIPTQTTADISALSSNEKAIYELIAKAYVAQFFEKHEYQESVLTVECQSYLFKTTSKITLNPGWLALYDKADKKETDDDNEDCSSCDLRQLQQHQKAQCINLKIDNKKTKPLPYYTMASLLQDLTRVSKYVTDERVKQLLKDKDKTKKGEHGGIGTPATRSAILKNLIERGFLEEKNKKIISTELGRTFFKALPEKATSPDMTALWHEQQQRIQQGELSVDAFLADLSDYIKNEIDTLKTHGLAMEVKGTECPACKSGVLLRRKGAKGYFWGCSSYPACKKTCEDKNNKPLLSKQSPAPSSSHLCCECEKPLIRRESKKKGSYWWGCSGFPECKSTYFDTNGKPDYQSKKAG